MMKVGRIRVTARVRRLMKRAVEGRAGHSGCMFIIYFPTLSLPVAAFLYSTCEDARALMQILLFNPIFFYPDIGFNSPVKCCCHARHADSISCRSKPRLYQLPLSLLSLRNACADLCIASHCADSDHAKEIALKLYLLLVLGQRPIEPSKIRVVFVVVVRRACS